MQEAEVSGLYSIMFIISLGSGQITMEGGVEVTLADWNGAFKMVTLQNQAGLKVKILTNGEYWTSVDKPGYKPRTFQIQEQIGPRADTHSLGKIS